MNVYWEAAKLLHSISLAVDAKDVVLGFPTRDLRKNTALALMRLTYEMAIIPEREQPVFLNEVVRTVRMWLLFRCEHYPRSSYCSIYSNHCM